MGADGHIMIWRDDVVRKEFPNCDDLFYALPTHYTDELDGVKYHHCYWGDNLSCNYTDSYEWYLKEGTTKEQIQKFVDWLEANGKHWEVWT